MDFDEVLQQLGEFGTYQKMVVYLVLLPAVIPCGFHAYNQVFLSATPDHWCRVPELEKRNLSVEAVKNLSIPLKGVDAYEECVYYDRNYSGVVGGENARMVSCRDGWVYDSSKYTSTVVTEWDLVCENDFQPTLALLLFGVGGAIGNYIFGYIQDSLGRKIAFFLYLFIESVFAVGSAFVSTFPAWVFLRFGVGFTVPAILESPYVIAVELVGPKKRAYCTILINIAYSLGLVILSGVVYVVRDWRQLTLATSLPFLLLFLYWCQLPDCFLPSVRILPKKGFLRLFQPEKYSHLHHYTMFSGVWVMPESPRWLYAKGRFGECEEILNKIAVVNGKDLIEFKYLDEGNTAQGKNYGVRDLFKLPNLRRKTVVITLIWFTNTAVYVGLSYYAPALGRDEFLNFFLAGVVELPTYFFLWPAMEKLGRRWTLCLSMVTGGVACLATVLTQNKTTVTLVLYCLGKMGISCSFVVLPLMASELYPTVVRGVGISFSSVLGQIGPIFIPLVNYLGKEWMVLPLIIMGGLLVVGGGLGLVLPETLHQPLPQTLDDAEMFGRQSWSFCLRTEDGDQNSSNRKKNEGSSKFGSSAVETEVQT